METRGASNGGRQDGESANVVRIPRDWFGPVDELVPIRPAAPPDDGTPLDSDGPLDPNAFWDGSSSSIHDAVEGTADRLVGVGSGRRGVRPAGVRWVAAALVLALVGAATVIGLVLGSPRSVPPKAAAASTKASRGRTPLADAREIAATAKALADRGATRIENRARVHHVAHHHQIPSAPVTEVAYRTTSPALPASPSSRPQPAGPGPNETASRGSSNAGASAANQASPTTFGANGALGPMSSPDG